MYAAQKKEGNDERRLDSIASLGAALTRSLEMAREYSPGSLGFTAAWEKAEAAVLRLGELVDCTTPLEPTLKVAGERILRGRRPSRGKPAVRDLRRQAARKR